MHYRLISALDHLIAQRASKGTAVDNKHCQMFAVKPKLLSSLIKIILYEMP